LFGVEDQVLLFLELRRDEALGVGKRLLADVVGRGSAAVHRADLRLRQFNIIPKDPVESDLQLVDAGPFSLAGAEGRDPTLGIARRFQYLVELGIIAVADRAAIADAHGRLLG